MREWGRVVFSARCAYCGSIMRDNDPALFVKAEPPYQQKRPFVYCVECRGPAPPDLPALGPKQQRTKKMEGLKRICATFTPKLSGRERQLNERDRT